ncbi:hypothetical protein [Klebsiella quasipneumoniae]|nr:hypothetical protein [Klebsiella quasipneumoniae]MDA5090158.1 hypothetical protein [Klebsiella quasipneumoniae subsp. quasipneumoniae]
MKVIVSEDDEEIAGRQPSCSGLDHSATGLPLLPTVARLGDAGG